MKNSTRYILLVIVLIIVIAGIYILQQKPASQTTEQVQTENQPQDSATEFKVGEPAPAFTLTDLEGNEVSLKDYRGKKVVLNLWASWCPFCIDEMPIFQQAYEDYKDDDFVIIGVNRAESEQTAQKFTDQLNITYPILLNPADDIAQKYNLRAMPTTYFIDEQGILLEVKHGAVTEEMFKDLVHSNYDFDMEIPEVEPVVTLEDEIETTDDVKHSVPLEDIVGGGPPKDGIPSIDDPEIVSIENADKFVNDEGLGIAVKFGDIARYYPFQILVWHEIVNDTVDDQPVLITYCPLCGTGIVYEPIINGEQVEFGTSGKLWNSNLVMYDRKTDTYWSQVLGEAIVGELTGTELKVLPHDVLTFEDWKKQNPDGEVLSKNTGYSRDYTRSPYGDYDTNRSVFFDVDYEDERYHPKEPTYTVRINENVKIYPVSELEQTQSPFTDTIDGTELEINYNNDNTIEIEKLNTGEQVIPSYGFWFSVIAVHPDAEVYEAEQNDQTQEAEDPVTYEGEILSDSQSPVINFNEDDYQKALESEKIIVLYFYANWCPVCAAEIPKMYDAFEELDNPDLTGFRVNFNDDETEQAEEDLAREFGVAYQHTKVILVDGERVLKAPDSWDKDRYLTEINKYLNQ